MMCGHVCVVNVSSNVVHWTMDSTQYIASFEVASHAAHFQFLLLLYLKSFHINDSRLILQLS